ncbi:MAG: hypothetical protein ACKPKO_16245, partial [Candidatus Fonsibacter sp.]
CAKYSTIQKTAQPRFQQRQLSKQDITSHYYYVYNYNHFIGMINVALETAFNLLITDLLNVNYYTPLDATVSTFLDFDPHTNKIILYAESFSVMTKYIQ